MLAITCIFLAYKSAVLLKKLSLSCINDIVYKDIDNDAAKERYVFDLLETIYIFIDAKQVLDKARELVIDSFHIEICSIKTTQSII